MAKTKNMRIGYIDVVAGVMIAWMILGHCSHFSHYRFFFYKYLSFYMPYFFYKSGMFFSVKNQTLLLKKDTSKLLRYFCVYSLIGWIVWCFCGLVDGSLTLNGIVIRTIYKIIQRGYIAGNGALWFLLSLFIVRQLANWILKKKVAPPIVAITCFALAFALYAVGWYRYSFWFGNILSGTCFFLLGNWIKDRETNRFLFLLSTFTYSMVLIASIVGWIDDFPYLYMHANKMTSGNYLLFYPIALAGIIMTNNIFRILCGHIKFRALEYIGVNAMNFYVTHWILFVFVVFAAKQFFNIDSPVVLFTILLGASILLLPIINEILNTLKTKKIFQNIL